MTDATDAEPLGRSLEDAIELIKRQRDLVIAMATGEVRIEEVEHQYVERRKLIRRALEGAGLADPFPWTSLWSAWKELQGVGGYTDRRAHVRELVDPVIEEVERRIDATPLDDDGAWAEPSWSEVDDRLAEMKAELSRASSLDDFQDVGRRCREIVAAAVNMGFTEDCVPAGEPVPSAADAKGRLDAYLANHFAGSSHDEFRAYLRKLLALANAVTHDEESAGLTAFAAAQGTIAFVRTMQEAEREVGRRAEF